MRIGIFTDVHANLEALHAVLAAFEHESIDAFYCLGDVVGYGANPEECASIVRKITKATVVGNHDAAVSGRMDYSFYYDAAREALDLHRGMISKESATWLKELPYKHNLEDLDIQLCHGAPYRTEEFEYIFAPEHLAPCFDIWDELRAITFVGHTHLCKAFAMKKGEVHELPATRVEIREGWKYLFSAGSVGQPRDYDNRAGFVVYDSEQKILEFKRVPYDVEKAASKVFASKLNATFGHRLFLGI